MDTNKGRKLNWKQACEMLNCSKSHFYNLVNEGKIPAFRCGKVRGGLGGGRAGGSGGGDRMKRPM
jgi:excisionase family DNA binding protein